MSLDVLKLIVHYRLDVCRRRNILAKESRIVFECVSLDFSDDTASFGYVFLELSARLDSLISIQQNTALRTLTHMLI